MNSSRAASDAQGRGQDRRPEAQEIRDDEHDREQRDEGQLGAEDSGEQETQQHAGADRGPGAAGRAAARASGAREARWAGRGPYRCNVSGPARRDCARRYRGAADGVERLAARAVGRDEAVQQLPPPDHPEPLARDPLLRPEVVLDGDGLLLQRVDHQPGAAGPAPARSPPGAGARTGRSWRTRRPGSRSRAAKASAASAAQRARVTAGRGRAPDSAPGRRAPRRSGAAGCTWPCGRCGSRCRS